MAITNHFETDPAMATIKTQLDSELERLRFQSHCLWKNRWDSLEELTSYEAFLSDLREEFATVDLIFNTAIGAVVRLQGRLKVLRKEGLHSQEEAARDLADALMEMLSIGSGYRDWCEEYTAKNFHRITKLRQYGQTGKPPAFILHEHLYDFDTACLRMLQLTTQMTVVDRCLQDMGSQDTRTSMHM